MTKFTSRIWDFTLFNLVIYSSNEIFSFVLDPNEELREPSSNCLRPFDGAKIGIYILGNHYIKARKTSSCHPINLRTSKHLIKSSFVLGMFAGIHLCFE